MGTILGGFRDGLVQRCRRHVHAAFIQRRRSRVLIWGGAVIVIVITGHVPASLVVQRGPVVGRRPVVQCGALVFTGLPAIMCGVCVGLAGTPGHG